MAKYTTQIRSIVENGFPIFDFDYPIFDENYRGVLEQNIINHYYFREIGFETVGQFKHFLKTWFQLEMPYYNRLYETEHIITKDDYYINLDNQTTRTVKTDQASKNDTTSTGSSSATATGSGSSTATTSSTNNGKTVFSDTPQARLQGEDYATNLTDVDDSGTSDTTGSSEETSTSEGSTNEVISGTGTLTTIEEYTEHFLGNASMRYNADILEEWKNTWRNIDKMIIEELNQFFMNIY